MANIRQIKLVLAEIKKYTHNKRYEENNLEEIYNKLLDILTYMVEKGENIIKKEIVYNDIKEDDKNGEIYTI